MRLDRVIARRPRLILGLVAAFTLLVAAGLPRLRVDSSIETMVVDGDTDRAAFDRKKETFGNDELVAVAIPFGDALSPDALAAQRRVTDRIALLPGVESVDSLTNTNDIVGEEGILRVDPLVPEELDPKILEAADIARIRERVEANQLWTGFLISRDRATAAIAVHLDDNEEGEARAALMDQIDRALRAELGSRPYYLAGHPFMKTEIGKTIQRDLGLFMPVTLCVMAALLWLGTGSWRPTIAILGTALVAEVWMLGLMGWLGEPLSAVSSTAPTILLALATAYLMHFAAAFGRQLNAGKSRIDAAAAALEEYAMPVSVASLTTAIGFVSLVTSSVPIVRGFGLDLALGMAAIMILGLIAMPALFAALPIVSPTPAGRESRLWTRLLTAITRVSITSPRAVIAVAVALGAVGAAGALRVEVDSSGPRKFARDSRFRVSSEFYRAHLSGDVVENVYLRAPSEGFFEPERLRRLQALQVDLEAFPEIDATLSIADHVALMNRAMHENRPDAERIPDSRAAVAQYVLLHSSSGDPEAFSDLVTPDYGEVRVIAKATVPSSRASADLRARVQALVAKHFPESMGPDSVLSTEILLSRAADKLATEQLRSFGGALIAILAAVVVGFRSLSAGLLMLLPNGLPLVINLGVMGAFGIPLNDTTSLISAIALGIGVDSTVHLLASVRRAEAENGSRRGSLVRAMLTVGRPVLLTSCVVISGFAVLLLSDFRGIVEMGGLMAFTMLLCLLADLFVTPAELVAWHRAEPGALAVLSAGDRVTAAIVEDAEGGARIRVLDPVEPNESALLEYVGSRRRKQGALSAGAAKGMFVLSGSSERA